MLGWALSFLVVALIAAALGFGGLVGTPAVIAQVAFAILMALFIGTVAWRRAEGKPPV